MKTLKRHLILGFDAGCMTCSELAHRIEEAAGGRLEVRSLHDPQVEHWRKQALGENASWAPTLIEVRGGQVKAWTGLKMGLVLSRKLGPGATWRVMQVLGEPHIASGVDDEAHSAEMRSISRRRFLKGLAGGLAAFSLLPADRAFASVSDRSQKTAGIPRLTRLSADSVYVNRLKRSKDVKVAINSFGKPKWNQVEKVQYNRGNKAQTIFLIPFVRTGEASADTQTTYLVTSGELRQEDAVSMAMQLHSKGKRAEFAWYLPEGSFLGTAEISRNGRLIPHPNYALTQESVQPASRLSFLRCFFHCVGTNDLSVECALECLACALAIECVLCFACGGIVAYECAEHCRYAL